MNKKHENLEKKKQISGFEIKAKNTNNSNNLTKLKNSLNVEVVGRNRTMIGTFNNTLVVLEMNQDGEIQIVITNNTEAILYNLSITFNFDNVYLQPIGEPTSTIGSVGWGSNKNNIQWSSESLSPNNTIYITFVLNAIKSGNVPSASIVGTYSTLANGADSVNITATVPSITILYSLGLKVEKFQRMPALDNANFTQEFLQVINGDILEYKITATNETTENLYNIKITDTLNNNLSYVQNSISVPTGTTAIWKSDGSTIVNGKTVGGIIEWNISILTTGISGVINLNFQVEIVN